MSRHHRRAAKVDANQSDIVADLRSIPGVTVALDHDDLFIGYRGRNYWFEVKNPDTVSPVTGEPWPSALKKSQVDLRKTWAGHYSVVWTLEQILIEIGILK